MKLEADVNIMSRHSQFEQLADLVDERLDPAHLGVVQQHLERCERCAADVAWLRDTIALMRCDTTVDVPAEVVQRAAQLFVSREQPALPLFRRLLASLTFDSLQLSPAAGLRAGPSPERQIIFHAGDYDVDLRVARSGAEWALSGQVLGPASGGTIEVKAPSWSTLIAMDELCEFHLSAVPPGNYVLLLRLDDHEVELPIIDLPE
jgi:anti-sigma factor RsiW